DGETETGTVGTVFRTLAEAVEDGFFERVGYTCSGVGDGEDDFVVVDRRSDTDRVRGVCVLHRVRGQLRQRLSQPLFVRPYHGVRGPRNDPVTLGQRARPGEGTVYQLGQVRLGRVEEVRSFGRGQYQQVVNDTVHPADLLQDECSRLGPFRRVVAHQFEMATDDRERRS